MSAETKRRMRRAQAIRAYVGANGSGKTLMAVWDLWPSMQAGRPVLSNLMLTDPATGEPHEGWVPLRSWRQLVAARSCDILLDEVTGVASARSYASLPAQLLQVLVQLRKRDCTLSWTSPNFARADVVLREVTRGVVHCKAYVPKPDPESAWPQNRLIVSTLYDAADFEEWSMQKVAGIDAIARGVLWRPGKVVNRLYDTKASVGVLDHLDVTGTCLECGGKRTQAKCGCPVVAEVPEPPAEQAEGPPVPLVVLSEEAVAC